MDEAMQYAQNRDVERLIQYLETNLPNVPIPTRDLQVEPLTVEELRFMTNQMDITQLRSFTATRAAGHQMQKARPTVRPVPKPAVPEAERHARAKVRAKAKAHQGVAGAADDQMGNTRDIADTGALLDGTPVTSAVQLNMMHQLVNAMGTLAGEQNPADRTANRVARFVHEAQFVEAHG